MINLKPNFTKLASSKVNQLALLITVLFNTLTIHASAEDGKPIFEKLGGLINTYGGYIASFIITPIAVLALIVNIGMLIWNVMTGNTQQIGGKLGWILGTILLATLGVWLGINAGKIF